MVKGCAHNGAGARAHTLTHTRAPEAFRSEATDYGEAGLTAAPRSLVTSADVPSQSLMVNIPITDVPEKMVPQEFFMFMSSVSSQVFCPSQWESHGPGEKVSPRQHRVVRVLLVTSGDSSVTCLMSHSESPHMKSSTEEPELQNPQASVQPRGFHLQVLSCWFLVCEPRELKQSQNMNVMVTAGPLMVL